MIEFIFLLLIGCGITWVAFLGYMTYWAFVINPQHYDETIYKLLFPFLIFITICFIGISL